MMGGRQLESFRPAGLEHAVWQQKQEKPRHKNTLEGQNQLPKSYPLISTHVMDVQTRAFSHIHTHKINQISLIKKWNLKSKHVSHMEILLPLSFIFKMGSQTGIFKLPTCTWAPPPRGMCWAPCCGRAFANFSHAYRVNLQRRPAVHRKQGDGALHHL